MSVSYHDLRHILTADAEAISWKVFARANKPIDAIKEVRRLYGAGLRDAKDIVEEYRSMVRVHAAREGMGTAHRTVTLDSNTTLTIKPNGDGTFHITKTSMACQSATESDLLQVIANLTADHYSDR